MTESLKSTLYRTKRLVIEVMMVWWRRGVYCTHRVLSWRFDEDPMITKCFLSDLKLMLILGWTHPRSDICITRASFAAEKHYTLKGNFSRICLWKWTRLKCINNFFFSGNDLEVQYLQRWVSLSSFMEISVEWSSSSIFTSFFVSSKP